MAASGIYRCLTNACLGLAVLCAQRGAALQSDGFDALRQTASKAQDAGNNEEAIADYKRALTLQPDWREGLWALGVLSYQLDRYSDAVSTLSRLVKLAPNAGAAYSLLGLSEFETGDYADAQRNLQRAGELNSAGDPAIAQVSAYHLALLLNRGGDFDGAARLLHNAFPQEDPPAQAKAAMGIALLHIPLLPGEIDPSQDALVQAAGQAAAVIAQGDAQRSVDVLAHLIVEYPRTPYLHLVYAQTLAGAGQSQQARAAEKEEAALPHGDMAARYRIGASKEAATTDTASSDAIWQNAMRDYSSGHYSEAITGLKIWVAHRPGDGTAWAVMGLSEFALKDYGNALIHLQRGQALGVSADRRATSSALYHLALLLNRSGNFEAATDLLARLVDYQPLAQDVQFALGLSLLRMPMLPSDLSSGQHALVENAGQIHALLLASKYDAAFPQFQKLIERYPKTPYLHYAYGTALESLSQFDDAKTQMREEAKVSPQSALPWIRIASISLHQHLGSEALPAATTGVKLAPRSADAHYVLGRAYSDTGNGHDAVTELEKAVSMAPESPETHFALSRVYAKAGMPEKAEQERAAFARLNALAEEQRASHGSQAYQGPREGAGISVLNNADVGANPVADGSASKQPQ